MRRTAAALAGAPVRYYALFYEVVDGFVERRALHRERHLELARAANARGELLLGGALGDPADRALLVFRAEDASVVERFAREDPYVVAGLVRRWHVEPWAVAVGGEAAAPAARR